MSESDDGMHTAPGQPHFRFQETSQATEDGNKQPCLSISFSYNLEVLEEKPNSEKEKSPQVVANILLGIEELVSKV